MKPSSTSRAIPLWRQLQAAASVLEAVRNGRSTSDSLQKIDADLRPGVQALSFHVLRNLGRAEALRRLLARKPPPAAVDALLCSVLALAWREDHAPYAPFTLVNQAVEAAKQGPATRAQASFVNACLRRFLRERDDLVAETDDDPVARWNFPRWWIDRVKKDHPDHWQAVLEASNLPAPLTLRINARKGTPQAYAAMLNGPPHVEAVNEPARPQGDYALVLERARPVTGLPGFAEGWFSVQDAAAQLAAPLLLDALPARASGAAPLRILDACAAPGGKTAHLLELADAHVTAIDVDPLRCERIHDTLGRLGLQAQVVAADATRVKDWWDGQPFDAVLLDAPCTASGIVRRHPDVRWLRRPTDVAQLAAIQARMLAVLWPLVQPGGVLLYCTCSVFRQEGEQQVQTFVAHNTDAVLQPSPGHLRPQSRAMTDAVPDNLPGDHDGFFYALLQKRASGPHVGVG